MLVIMKEVEKEETRDLIFRKEGSFYPKLYLYHKCTFTKKNIVLHIVFFGGNHISKESGNLGKRH